MIPRNRPRAAVGGGAPHSSNAPATTETQSTTLLQQAQALNRYNDSQTQQNIHPQTNAQHRPPGNHPAYLNPFGERPSRDPSPVGKRFVDREFTHTRSRSDPVFVRNHIYVTANQSGGSQNVVQLAQQQQQRQQPQQQQQQQQHINVPQITYRQKVDATPNFPKWNPFSNDFVLNTETTDDDFASLREPKVQHGQQSAAARVESAVQHCQQNVGNAYASQFVSGNMQSPYVRPASNKSLSTQRSSSNSNVSPYASDSSRRSSDCEDDVIVARPIVRPSADETFGGSQKNAAFLDGPVNAGCDVDEMTTRFERNTAMYEPSRAQSGHANDTAVVFDSAPFRKPVKSNPVGTTTPAPPVSPRRDPFGAVPFKQREAAKLARRQARKSTKEQSSGEARRVLPTVPTQARR